MRMKKRIHFIVILVFVYMCGLISYGFVKHEIQQNEKIMMLSAQLENKDLDINFSEDGYNYLAIGNSITLHEINDYWWNECGMAASKETEDYYHKLCEKLKDEYGKISTYAYNFSIWEIMATDRAETLALIEPYLDKNLNLVTVQLGENVTNLNDFESDFEYLLEYIAEKLPNSEIIVIGDFWEKDNRDSIKEKVCLGGGWKYVDLSEIKDSSEYECGINTIVYDKEGNGHTVTHSGVALHPNNKGMSYIADAIFDKIKTN